MMKTPLLTLLCSSALALSALAQDPTATPSPSPALEAASPAVAPAGTPAATVSPSRTDDDSLESRIERRVRDRIKSRIHRDRDRDDRDPNPNIDIDFDDEDLQDIGALAAIPIVGIIFGTLSLFLTPVVIVLVIMFFSYLKARSLHRTVRMMVEKGQEVPAALFAPPQAVRGRSDMRRGVILVMVGLGLMLFFAAVNDWEGGAWALGLIPFLIGAGYLSVWWLEGNKPGFMKNDSVANTSTDNPPPLP